MVAELLVEADLLGFDTHGIAHLGSHPGYVPGVRAGHVRPGARFEVVRESVATALVDGNGGIGMVTAVAGDRSRDRQGARRRASARSRCAKGATSAPRRSTRCGSRDADMIGIVTTNASPWVVPTFGRERMLGTNPIAVAAPTETTTDRSCAT